MGRLSRIGATTDATDDVRRNGERRTSADLPARDAAVDGLFRLHYAELLRLGYFLVGDRQRAEDAVQDAFISVYAHWDRIRDHASDLSYLRSAVIYRCRSRMRERLRELAAPGEFESVGARGQAHRSSEDEVVSLEWGERLATAVRSLPRRQREVLVCRYYLELNVRETAAFLEISDGAVKQHTHRGLEGLNTRLGGVR